MAAMILPAMAFAGSQEEAVVALHVGQHLQKGDTPCDWADGAAKFPCNEFVVNWPVFTSANVYLVVAYGDPTAGVGAVSCGILYEGGAVGGQTLQNGVGLDVYGFTLCTSGLQFPNGPTGLSADEWPASGGGNRITWDVSIDCQTDEYGVYKVHALAGSFYVYAYGPDQFQVTPNNNLVSGIPEFQVGDCSNAVSNLDYPIAAGVADFGGTNGYNPCLVIVPTEKTSWSQIKQQY